MKMLHQRHRNGLDYCSRNGNGAVKEQKHPVALVPQKYITITSKTCCHSATTLQLQYCNTIPHFDRNSNRIDHDHERKIYRTGTEKTTTMT